MNNNSEIKIISLTPSITKIIYELGSGNDIVGVSDYCEYKGQIKRSVKAGTIKRAAGFNSFNYEQIVALSPTHIFGMDSVSIENKVMLENLVGKRKLYWFLHPRDFDDIKSQIKRLSKILNKEEKANKINADIDKRLNKLLEKTNEIKNKPKVLIEIYYPPFMTAGNRTFISDIVKKAGGKSAVDLKDNWPSVSMEDLVASDPDVILKTHTAKIDKNLRLISAYNDNRIFIPKDVDVFLQPGIESINAVEELYEYLYK